MLQRERKINGQTSRKTHYYISRLDANAAKPLAAICTYWVVENQLHWALDVAFDEDACRLTWMGSIDKSGYCCQTQKGELG
jgi:predicted transposase YbfD/YdcC